MKIAFRTDASLQIGTGHVVRCLTLSGALRSQGADCHFISREHPGHLLETVRRQGFSTSALPPSESHQSVKTKRDDGLSDYSNWLGGDWRSDAQMTSEILAELKPDWLVVDHYAVDERWETTVHRHCSKMLVLDDMAVSRHACDLLLDQNLGRQSSDYARLVPEHCTVLSGPRYALLRPQFAALREYSLARRKNATLRRVVVTMGGVDQPNATGQALEALKECALPANSDIIVVLGGQAPSLSRVREIAATMPWPTDVRVDTSDVAQIMADSDLAIGAAGSTSWERCCLGLPTLVVVLAENQRSIAKSLDDSGVAITLELRPALRFATSLKESIAKLVNDEQRLKNMGTTAATITDGRGSERVLQQMWSVLKKSEDHDPL